MKLSITPTQAVSLQLKRVTLTPETHESFLTYKRAIAEVYNVEIEDEDLAAKLIEQALRNDRSLRDYRRASSGQPAAQQRAAPPSPAAAEGTE
jgi:hypothetical protein